MTPWSSPTPAATAGTCSCPPGPPVPNPTTTGSSPKPAARTCSPGTSGRRRAGPARASGSSRWPRSADRRAVGPGVHLSPRRTDDGASPARPGDSAPGRSPGTSPLGPWDIAGAQPFTAEPGLFAAPLVRRRDGTWALVGFRNLEALGFEGFEILDPIPVRLEDGDPREEETMTDPLPTWRDGATKDAGSSATSSRPARRVHPASYRWPRGSPSSTTTAPCGARSRCRSSSTSSCAALVAMAEAEADLRERQPWKAAYERDSGWLAKVMDNHYAGDDTNLPGGCRRPPRGVSPASASTSSRRESAAFLRDTRHPTLGRGYLTCAYAPMVERLGHLRALRLRDGSSPPAAGKTSCEPSAMRSTGSPARA